ncbi:MAG: nucleotide pyrophosphatase/phosphodiesterase family protein [Balneolaceae bacterium]
MRAKKTVVLNAVGLTPDRIGPETPFLSAYLKEATLRPVQSMLPAVTCSVQATYLTGKQPVDHGIVGNGWYFRDMDEIKFWRQSNRLIQAKKIWEELKERDPEATTANLFWWYNMNSDVDYLVTPRPIYRSDGVKIPDILTYPMTLRDELQDSLGPFPLFKFWGPMTSIESTQWIAEAAKRVEEAYQPTLSLVYLPHLDYNHQRVGPDHPDSWKDLRDLDRVLEDLIGFFEERDAHVLLLSEYGIEPVHKPVHLNRKLRENGYVTVRNEMGGEVLISGASRAFAVADHQVAHLYIKRSEDVEPVRHLLSGMDGVEQILDREDMKREGLNHERSGELMAIAEPDAWFTYYYWLDESCAPDFAPTVDIHTKPGYDPAELLINPDLRMPKLRAARRLLQKKLGLRYRMDLVSTRGEGVRGSHGRHSSRPERGPLLITRQSETIDRASLAATDVHDVILDHLFPGTGKT